MSEEFNLYEVRKRRRLRVMRGDSWRSKGRDITIKDETTYFFSRFPEDLKESDLWGIFRRWRDKSSHRFGFVRFKGVENVLRLEKQLEDIVIGSTKLHVNLPKYRKQRVHVVGPSTIRQKQIQHQAKAH